MRSEAPNKQIGMGRYNGVSVVEGVSEWHLTKFYFNFVFEMIAFTEDSL